MGLDSDATGGIEICADTNQYFDFTTMLNNYNGDLVTSINTYQNWRAVSAWVW